MSQKNKQPPKCLSCKSYQGPGIFGDMYLAHTCPACPEGIPQNIIQGDPELTPANSQCKFIL